MSFPTPGVARGPIRETSLDAPCPVCGHAPLLVRSLPLELPFFGEASQTTILCEACAYRHADLLLTRQGTPCRITLRVLRPDQLSARVARSSSGTIRIPELGAVLEPGPRAEAFVSNVEGVLRKFLDVVEGQQSVAASPAARRRLAAVHRRFQGVLDGRTAFTFLLEDPTGNSDIAHREAVRVGLSKTEAARLRSSRAVVDLSDLGPGDEEE